MPANPITIPINPPPQCPADMSAEVRAEFDRIVGLVGHRVRDEDRNMIVMLAASWCQWRTATAQVEQFGITVMSGGCAIENPALQTAARAQRQIIDLSKALGITPPQRKGKKR